MSVASVAALASQLAPAIAKAILAPKGALIRRLATTIPRPLRTTAIVSTWIHVVFAVVPALFMNAVVRISQLAPAIAKAM